MEYRWTKVKKWLFPVISFALTLLVSLFWVALRVNYAGISKFLGADTNQSFLIMNLPVMVCAVSWVGFALALWGIFYWEKRKWPSIVGFAVGIVMTGAAVAVVIFGAKDYLRFILPHFYESAGVAGAIVIFGLILLFPIREKKWLKALILAAVVVFAVVTGYQLRPCHFTYGAVVYAVEDEYQIVFSTSDSAIAWVEIGGECYYDLYAGSMRSVDKVHKVTVPQSVLDEAAGYSVHAKQMIYRGPFGGYTGPEMQQEYAFYPVDSADGLNYYAISDVHEAVDAAVKAASGAGELDFLVLLGDLVSMVETEADAQLANELAHGITKGQIPVIYARGNHEIKGEYSEVLYKYVGSKNQEFYYTVTLGDDDVFAAVLDIGEDHEDDWWEYYGTAQFKLYRQKQTAMLEQILESGAAEPYRYRMALCHIPLVYVGSSGYFEEDCKTWTSLCNEIGMDIGLSGHKHVLWALLPGQAEPFEPLRYSESFKGVPGKVDWGYLTDFSFPYFLVGRRSLLQSGGTQSDGNDQYIGLYTHVDVAEGFQSSMYLNSDGQTPEFAYPFVEETYTEVRTELAAREK